MKKPPGKAEAGWYEHQGLEGYEKYWNGKSWSKHDRLIGEEGPIVFPANVKHLGQFLFRKPIGSDRAFIAYVVVSIASVISGLIQDSKSGLNLAGQLAALTGSVLVFLWVYVIFLIYLVPRRIVDRKRGVEKFPLVENKSKTKSRTAFMAVGIVATLLAVGFIAINQSRVSPGDKYFEVEQKISAVVKEWNVAATPISQAIQEISNGTMLAAEARKVAGDASAQFAVVNNHLDDVCADIPPFDLNATGEEGAVAKAYNALKVTCDLLPSESAEILLLVIEQINPNGTQAQIDFHSNQIQEIIGKRKQALIDSIDAIKPYMNNSQRMAIERLRNSL